AAGLGARGCPYLEAAGVRKGVAAVRERTNKPFALNFLIFDVEENGLAAALAARPAAIAYAWPRPDQELKPYVARAHDVGAKVTFMAGGVPEALRAAQARAHGILAPRTPGAAAV